MSKRWAFKILIFAVLIAIAGSLLWLAKSEKRVVQLGQHTFQVTVLKEKGELVRGLSGTASLPSYQAMLFDFSAISKWGIWMKDMNYPIDIIWLDNNKKIAHLVENAQPSSYPEIFRPDTGTRYVIEVASGTIEKTGINKGDLVGLPSGL